MIEEISCARMGRLFWIIGGSLLLFTVLGMTFYYINNQKEKAQTASMVVRESPAPTSTAQKAKPATEINPSGITEADIRNHEKEVIDGFEVKTDGERIIAISQQKSCPMERCDGNTFGTVIEVEGNILTISEKINPGADAVERKITLPEKYIVRHFDQQEEEYLSETDISIGDLVVLTVPTDTNTAEFAVVIK